MERKAVFFCAAHVRLHTWNVTAGYTLCPCSLRSLDQGTIGQRKNLLQSGRRPKRTPKQYGPLMITGQKFALCSRRLHHLLRGSLFIARAFPLEIMWKQMMLLKLWLVHRYVAHLAPPAGTASLTSTSSSQTALVLDVWLKRNEIYIVLCGIRIW